MSIQLIQQYHAQVDKIIRYGGSRKETAVRKPFQDLLEQYARQKNLELIAELEYRTRNGRSVYPDGTLKDALRQDWGYWEAKDEADDLDTEIANKLAKGYPANNMLFEDTQTAVLYQNSTEVARVSLLDAPALDALLTRFVSYESREVREFREAIENFSRDIPALGETLRGLIREQYERNKGFQKEAKDFLELCQEAINPSMEMSDVREMMVQHVLTEDIFVTVFDEPQFHRENIIAHELGTVVGTFYKGQVRRQIDGKIAGYTQAIKARAAQIYNHQEKQKFLKVLYENFYKAYNPKAADRLGIVYTPNEIVRFMIEAADHLCFKHFGRTLGDKGVEILDPATGTGTFITELIEYLPPHQLEHKYRHELHCNEVSILPYYIANLNIEYTYKQKMGAYLPFDNIVFVDTLDNMGFAYQGKQLSLFGLTDENAERIQRQNQRDISVIIGNPPYNANQLNENENNKNREYPEIDRRIKETYIKHSTAQKTKLYDMYTRFYRWATDRLQQNGIVAFITNRSFLDARTFDGFRKVVTDEFSDIYVVDLGGDVRKNPKLSGPRHNVFAIQTGVAIAFLVRKRDKGEQPAQIWYARRPEMEEAPDKLRFLATTPLSQLKFERIQPSDRNNWLNIPENSWDDFLPLLSKDAKLGKVPQGIIAQYYSGGAKTNRDDWAIDVSRENLETKMRFLTNFYNTYKHEDTFDTTIKWSRDLKVKYQRGNQEHFSPNQIVDTLYRPYCHFVMYDSSLFVDVRGITDEMYLPDNVAISISGSPLSKPFQCLATRLVPAYDMLEKTQCFTLYRRDQSGNRIDNITDWALAQFRHHYANLPIPQSPNLPISNPQSPISKHDIFHYVYAVLHHPAYREKYRLNLKRDFPRIPFYPDFWQWAAWGKALMALHLHYETIEPHPLLRHETDPETTRTAYKAKLKADKANGTIELDTLTTLSGIPALAWQYQLGNRSALEWVLDRYKERTPKDPTIREQFNSYRFADYKEQVIDLLGRITAVSLQTMHIIHAMNGTMNGAMPATVETA
ncbi:MAG: N-6 DNA methylase [Ardenticatenaceae bacterium]|nr:N-6 DNA methylase [Ardenticatenaceae bacterium]